MNNRCDLNQGVTISDVMCFSTYHQILLVILAIGSRIAALNVGMYSHGIAWVSQQIIWDK